MAKNKKPADAAKDKAAKQKKIAIGLVVLLAVAMAYAVNTMMGMSGGSGTKPQAADSTAAVSTTPVATPDPTAAAAPSLAGAPVAADPAAPVTDGTTAAGSTQLLAAVSPPADAGQLESFSRFESRDPFAGSASASGGSGSGSGTTSGGSSGSGSGSPPAVPPAPPNPPPSSAVISVNGLAESVSTNGIFPTASTIATTNGLFELVSLTAKTATVSVVGGSYASGSQTLKLEVGKAVTLVNTADGTRYTLLLYAQGTSAPAAPAASGASGAVAPVTPPTTTAPPTTTTTGG
jgi:hypothetical protein